MRYQNISLADLQQGAPSSFPAIPFKERCDRIYTHVFKDLSPSSERDLIQKLKCFIVMNSVRRPHIWKWATKKLSKRCNNSSVSHSFVAAFVPTDSPEGQITSQNSVRDFCDFEIT